MASGDSVATANADAVILAAGAERAAAPIPGIEAMTVEALLADARDWSGKRVAIRDEAGSWATLSAAETLLAAGAEVEIFQASTVPLWSVTLYARMTALERLANAGAIFRYGHTVTGGTGDGTLTCRIAPLHVTENFGPFDALVHSTPGEAATALQAELEAAGLTPLTIGDATAPRTLYEAMQDAQRVARAL